MYTINLNNLIFYAFHGVHEEERVLGNTYEVSVAITFDTQEQIITLDQTVNYATIYELIKQKMMIPAALLESLARDIADEICTLDKRIVTITVSVTKINPPLPNFQGSVNVCYTSTS